VLTKHVEIASELVPSLARIPSLHKTNVLAVDITMLPHPLAECIEEMLVGGRGLGAEERDAGGYDQTVRLLCARRERPSGRAADERNELAPSHSITSSARPSSDGGTSSPSALAVLRLTTSSNLTGAWTGSSLGFEPLRMRSAYDAARRYSSTI
jgi:hypothetical protein